MHLDVEKSIRVIKQRAKAARASAEMNPNGGIADALLVGAILFEDLAKELERTHGVEVGIGEGEGIKGNQGTKCD